MNNQLTRFLLPGLLALWTLGSANAQDLLIQFDPGANDQNTDGFIFDTTDLAADTVAPGLLATALTQSQAIGYSNNTNVWPVGLANTLSFTVFPEDPFPYNLTSVVYTGRSYGNSSITVELRTSLDGFATALDTFTTTAAGFRDWQAVLQFPATFRNLTNSVELRLVFTTTNGDFADLRGTLSGGQGLRLFGSQGTAPNFTGRVTRSADGSPVEGVTMNLFSPDTGEVSLGTTTTDGAGRYAFTLSAGNYTVRTENAAEFDLLQEIYDNTICTPSCEPGTGDTAAVTAGSITDGIDFQLDPAGAISGRVTRTDNGQPLDGVLVAVYEDTDAGDQLFIRARGGAFTDANGQYTVRGLPTGNYVAYTERNGGFGDVVPELYNDVPCPCALNEGTSIAVTAGATTTAIDFALETDPGSISGRVTDSGTGAPIEGIEIQAQDLDLVLGSEPAQVVAGRAFTDANGDYTIQAVTPGNYLLVTSGDEQGYRREFYDDVKVGESLDLVTAVVVGTSPVSGIDFALDRGGSISGRITRSVNGTPVAGILVIANDTTTGLGVAGMETDADGNYTLPAIEAGTYRVSTFSGRLFNLINAETTVSITDGQDLTGVNLALDPGATIRGQVRSEIDGSGLLGLLTSVSTADFSENSQGFTDSAGNYTIQGLVPGTYYAQVSRAGQFSLINEIHDNVICVGFCDVTRGTPITVDSGDVAVIDLDLAPIPRGTDALPDDLDDLGAAVAIDGNTVVVGMPGDDTMGTDAGAIVIYRATGDGLKQIDKVFADVPEPGARFGAAVDVRDGLIAVGAPADGVIGKGMGVDKKVVLLRLTGGSTAEIGSLLAENLANGADSGFARAVSIDDSGMVAVAAPNGQKAAPDGAGNPSGTNSGAIVLFEPSDGDNFVQTVVLNDENGQSGDGLGMSLDVSKGRIAAGAPNALTSGTASIFQNIVGSNWGQIGKFRNGNPGAGDRFGEGISIDGDKVLVGAPGNDDAAADAGAAFAFEFDGDNFVETGSMLPIDGDGVVRGVAGGNFGSLVRLSGDEAAVGASGEEGMASGTGAAYVFQRAASQWQFSDRVIDDTGQTGDRLGQALDFDGENIVIGAPRAQVAGQRAGLVLGVAGSDVLFGNGFE